MSSSPNNSSKNGHTGTLSSLVITIIRLLIFVPLGIILLLSKINFSSKNGNSSASRPSAGSAQAPPQAQRAHRPQEASSTQQKASAAQGYYNASQTTQRRYSANSPRQTTGKGRAILMSLLGIVLLFTGSILAAIGLSFNYYYGMDATNLGMIILGACCLITGMLSWLTRNHKLKQSHRYNTFAAVVGMKEAMSVAEISKSVGASAKKTRKTLQAMIELGYFGPKAYIDNDLDSIVRSNDAAEKSRRSSPTTVEAAAPITASENQFVAVINELHIVCSKTIDPVICDKIVIIEELTVKIFKIIDEKPEKLPQIRRFMNYYLPTTLKLLHSYETLEKQGISGDNITSAKQDIQRILDTLTVGYAQQLDNLFKSDKLDISADIDVLENMLEQDGLTSAGSILKAAGGQ